MTTLCDEATLMSVTQAMHAAPVEQLGHIDDLIGQYPEDARLHFLRGSILVGDGRLVEAHQSLAKAVAIAPDFAIARFQLGFFQLTSGEADNALDTFGRLDRLPDGHYLRWFADGLRSLIRDDFAGAIQALQDGIAANAENPPMNSDMQLIIDQCRPLLQAAETDDAAVSETSLILKRFGDRSQMN